MRMERLAVTMPHSTARAFRRYSQVHDLDLCVVAKMAVTEMCRLVPQSSELTDTHEAEPTERIFISLPDTAMRLLEFWSERTGIQRTKLMEWSIRKFTIKEEDSQQ